MLPPDDDTLRTDASMTLPDDDALRTDAYLDRLMGARAGTPHRVADDDLVDPELAEAAEVVRTVLVRFHPSFRFADRLAARLATASAARDAAPPAGELVSLPIRRDGPLVGGDSRGRLLLSGAIASGVSIAGAAIIAWRRSRPPTSAASRAARAVSASRVIGSRAAKPRIRREWLS